MIGDNYIGCWGYSGTILAMPKKLGGVLLFVGALVAGTFVLLRNQTPNPGVLAVSSQHASGASDADADSDGLADWEETLGQSPPDKPDTDGDGINDGQEARTKPEPAPTPASSQTTDTYTYKYGYDPKLGDTLTDQVGRNLIYNYLQAKSTGVYSSDLGKTIVGDISNTAVKVELYQDIESADLDIVPATADQSKVIAYAGGVDKASMLAFAPGRELGEARILSSVIQGDSYSDLSKLDPYIKNYERAREALLAIAVPRQFTSVHLEYVQSFDTVAKSLKNMRERADADPVLVMRELSRYALGINNISSVYARGNSLVKSYLASAR